MAVNFMKIRNGVTVKPVTAPGTPENGDIYYDSGSNLFQFYQNGTLIAIPTTYAASIGSYDSQAGVANGLQIISNVLYAQSATASVPGMMSTGTQTIAGAKTFSTSVISGAFTSSSANPSATGIVRLANADSVSWRNSGNSADQALKPDADGILQYAGVDLVTISATQTLTSKTIAAGSNTITGLTNANLSGSAAITNANLASMANNTVKANISGGSATPSDVSAVSTATASTFVVRDTNINTYANAFAEKSATTATGGTTTTLTVSSAPFQQFTGTTTQTVVLPDATTLTNGFKYWVANRSTGTVTVQANGGGTLQAMVGATYSIFTLISNGTSAGTWDTEYIATSSGSGSGVASAGVTSKNTTYVIVSGDNGKVFLADTTSAAFSFTLPTASSGFVFTIKDSKGNFGTNNCTLARAASESIEGVAASFVMSANWGSWTFASDGTNWFIMAH